MSSEEFSCGICFGTKTPVETWPRVDLSEAELNRMIAYREARASPEELRVLQSCTPGDLREFLSTVEPDRGALALAQDCPDIRRHTSAMLWKTRACSSRLEAWNEVRLMWVACFPLTSFRFHPEIEAPYYSSGPFPIK